MTLTESGPEARTTRLTHGGQRASGLDGDGWWFRVLNWASVGSAYGTMLASSLRFLYSTNFIRRAFQGKVIWNTNHVVWEPFSRIKRSLPAQPEPNSLTTFDRPLLTRKSVITDFLQRSGCILECSETEAPPSQALYGAHCFQLRRLPSMASIPARALHRHTAIFPPRLFRFCLHVRSLESLCHLSKHSPWELNQKHGALCWLLLYARGCQSTIIAVYRSGQSFAFSTQTLQFWPFHST